LSFLLGRRPGRAAKYDAGNVARSVRKSSGIAAL